MASRFQNSKGYDVWPVISLSQADGGIKATEENSVMMKAISDGIAANGKAVPDGATMAKIKWSSKNNPILTGAPKVADTLQKVGFMTKDAKRFPDTDGWGYAEFVYDTPSGTFKPIGKGHLPHMPHGCEGARLRLHDLCPALNGLMFRARTRFRFDMQVTVVAQGR